MLKINEDIRLVNTSKFSVLWSKIRETGTISPRINELILKAGIESGIAVGGTVEDVDGMKTSKVVALSNDVMKAFVSELRPANDPN